MNPNLIYPRSGDRQTVYLKNVVSNSNIEVGDFTIYNDFVNDPRDFEKNNVLYRYPINGDRLKIGRFCSIACGAKFLFTSGNHTLRSLSTYTFPIFFDEWNLDKSRICEAWDNKGDIELGNDVWVGYEAVIMSGVKIGSGAIIGRTFASETRVAKHQTRNPQMSRMPIVSIVGPTISPHRTARIVTPSRFRLTAAYLAFSYSSVP